MANVTEHPIRVKRRKLDDKPHANQEASFTSPAQLREVLSFKQNPQLANKGIIQFKQFLLSIGQASESDKAEKLRVLKAYCDKQFTPAKEEGAEAICFSDITQTWNFGEGSNHDHLLTNVPSVLAIFLKTISGNLEFRDFGLALCKHLLQKDQLRLFNRGLTAFKSKEHLISPCLRLLTEMVTFDGGAVARQLYLRRHITFKRLEMFLTPSKAQMETGEDESQKSTLRRNAQRYLLANLRVQQHLEKGDIIEQHKLTRAFLDYLRKDPRETVLETIKSIERDIVQDASLSRKSKSKFFNRWNMEKLVTLYGYDRESDEPNPEGISIADEIHRILLNVCKTAGLGVLLPENGWYPVGTDPESLIEDETSIELGLDSPIYVDKYRDLVPVRNNTLSHLIQCLRPDADSLQIELLVTIFKVAPELIADFFTKKVMFTSDPKATPSWMAESALLFSIVQLPVPTNCGWKNKQPMLPPPVSIVAENILPRPLSQKIMTRCLNQNAEIVTLFAVRMLTLSFTKLRAVLKIFRADHGRAQLFWNQASSKLLAEFSRRCPAVKDVVLLFRRTAKEDLQQQEAVAELLTCYYEVMPDIALEENFDVSLVLVDVLKRLEESDLSADDSELLLSQLQSVLQIAQQSASLRWWQKPASMNYTPFTSILKVLIDTSDKVSSRRISILLRSILVENSVLHNAPKAFNALLSSLEDSENELPKQLVFFDNCVSRVAKKPVHYLDLVGSLSDDETATSPIVAAIMEQWPFVVKAGDETTEAAVASWIAKFLGQLKKEGESSKALKAARDSLVEATETKKIRSLFKKCLKGADDTDEEDKMDIDSTPAQSTGASKASTVDLDEIFGFLPSDGTSHNALHRWEREEIEVAIEQGHIDELILCLCSEHEEVRRQAVANLVRFMAKLKESNYAEWRTVYTLIGELLETASSLGFDKPIPWIIGECASNCLSVLLNPLHKVYGKVNKFLQKAPSWEVEKIPSYWIDRIFLHEPELDDGYFEEIDWLLGLFVKGLRSNADMEIYRRANVFERILSLYQSPSLNDSARRKILHIIYRAAQVGGSSTLITRSAVISWIQVQTAELEPSGKDAALLAALARALYETSDRERIDTWSAGTVERALKEIETAA
ncbi:hypothetical protein N7490_000807 [Penicillium lividum]|nr:hypothetical protein N7490_000807 [Penicillium lividum]